MIFTRIRNAFETITTTSQIVPDEETLGFSFVNRGNTRVILNNSLYIDPGQVFETLEYGFKDVTKYDIRFENTFNVAIQNNELFIIYYQQM